MSAADLVRELLVEANSVWLSDDYRKNRLQRLITDSASEHAVIRAVGELLAQYLEGHQAHT